MGTLFLPVRPVYGFLILILISLTAFAEQKSIFFLHTYPWTYPWTKTIDEGMDEALSKRKDWVLYSESLDTPRLGDSMSPEDWREYISRKYGAIEFDAVLAESSQASRFIYEYGPELFGDVPMVLFTSEDLSPRPDMYYLVSQLEEAARDSFQMALEYSPGCGEVVIIQNHQDYYNGERLIIEKLAEENSIKVKELSEFTIDELKENLLELRGDEIVFYFPVFIDSSGKSFVPRQVLSEISQLSPSPIYVLFGSLMGGGCVGGVMLDGKKIALEMFRALDDFFQTGEFRSDYSTNQAIMDWQIANKYHLKPENADENVILLNRPISLLRTYLRQILLALSGILLIFLSLILALVLYSRHRIAQAHSKLEKLYWLQERQARMGEMMNFVAHQWQQYLYTISLYIKGMEKKELLKPEGERHSESLSVIKNTLASMFTTLNNFRNFINPRKKREKFPVSEQCEAVLSLLEDLLSARGIDLIYTDRGDTMVWGVRNELEQVMINLIGNAVNILKERSIMQPVIVLTVEGREDSVLVKIEDNGGGIRPEVAEGLFEKYQTTREEGSGLGLYMSRRIIRERFDGSLTLERGELGALFKIDIPREPRRKKRSLS